LSKLINSLLSPAGFQLVRESMLYEWQKGGAAVVRPELKVPEDAAEYLSPVNQRLAELKSRYASFQSTVTEPIVWTDDYIRSYDLLSFRGDNCYVWQSRDRNSDEVNYALTTYYVKSIDRLGLLGKLEEDGSFGVHTHTVDARLVSRDLLDSIVEIYFLEKNLALSSIQGLRMLDIGAGYGRLASRAARVFDNLTEYVCTDAVPESTYISDYYLQHRGVQCKTNVVPLDEIEVYLKRNAVHVAVNIHSFSECSIEAIRWWLDLLASNRVPYLMIVPNAVEHGGERLELNNGQDFSNLVKECGYELMVRSPKFMDPVVQRYGISPTWHYLFKLSV